MSIVPIKLPPGLNRNGTPYSRKGRYENANLVRFHDGSYRAIGGWLRRRAVTGSDIAALVSAATAEAVRDIFAWRSIDQSLNAVFGSNLALYYMDSDGVVTDVTYSGYAALNSSKDSPNPNAYGRGAYGAGAYSVNNILDGAETDPPDRWYFDNFGEVLLTGSINNGGIYELDLTGPSLSLITGAPTDNADICVTDERQVMAVGAGGEPRQPGRGRQRQDAAGGTGGAAARRSRPGRRPAASPACGGRCGGPPPGRWRRPGCW